MGVLPLLDGLPLSQLALGFLRRRHAAVANHGFGQCDGGRPIDVIAVDVLAMGKAMAGCIFDAPCATRR